MTFNIFSDIIFIIREGNTMNSINAIIISTLVLIVPILAGLACALGWSDVVKVLFVVWTIVEWGLIATIIQMLFREENV